ncbi:MAG: peptide-methionine (S)-S-oxide reductase, partial [Deltaproteobacteria bacterium]|nr:peptide-methionine (S)-S-oxide reductase [Deltaproteobacteria bacterium]
YNDDEEKKTAYKLIDILKGKGYKIATEVLPAKEFYKAEEYHQDYYRKHNKEPYCHTYKKKF